MLPHDLLLELLQAHSTPGDEAEVRAVLERAWRAAGWQVTRLGDPAVTAGRPRDRGARPTLLITAHMDSPGFTVDRLPGSGARRRTAGIVRLGGAAFPGSQTPGVLKTVSGRTPVRIRKRRRPGGEFVYDCAPAAAGALLPPDLRHGDRVCFACEPTLDGTRIAAPFLDNRLGCWILALLAPRLAAAKTSCRIVLGATGSEEFGGFGAAVLARQVQPDLAIVLDATYAAPEQNVHPGAGPVLTLSDASVLLSPIRRDWIQSLLSSAGIPLQTEVYNFSGTDARAFPHQGLACPVFPLLLATTGNHSPRETADLRDAVPLLQAIECLATTSPPP
jgi:endoglucanase